MKFHDLKGGTCCYASCEALHVDRFVGGWKRLRNI